MAQAQALGRGRGGLSGLSTKIIATIADEDTVLTVDVVPRQAGDAPLLVPVPDRTLARGPVDEIVGDKAFDGDQLRCDCLNREVNPNIPLKSNRDPDQWVFDTDSYKERNRVERLFGKAKPFRRIATRYEKLKVTHFGLLHVVLGFIRLRKLRNVNTP
ncbi:Uncharacterized protein OS=Candidatus Competibacter denitrificans Run_A_D11 GN=BN873_470112 PE=4 SV=1: DDE_Tnp_1_2 [Gemmata massiliana]|uniref:Transposase DDE domain-containing protein n=1 Tax=Gemmata massiliana TaxID=1210884 RepID=A0A6P2CXH7_9BACT|nr:transposase [Gemmata massiliana]VTR93659.1 Uncharacterized protein OS=Candidatus Competibacter denitrificans Run_A_D11 GN=BN873_470112 PE=4 SV=1: DDE_Tnp_1_2 [Gemmata massiliana]